MIENSLELFHRQAARLASPGGVLDSTSGIRLRSVGARFRATAHSRTTVTALGRKSQPF